MLTTEEFIELINESQAHYRDMPCGSFVVSALEDLALRTLAKEHDKIDRHHAWCMEQEEQHRVEENAGCK